MGTASELGQLFRVSWSLFLGNTVKWYEFAVYGYMEDKPQHNFFRGSAIATWLGFAVTLARPLGGLILGYLGDTFGRRQAVNISIVAMLVGTCGQGMLPTYASGSDALGDAGLVLLFCLCFLQGLSAAGEISTIATYITEVGSNKVLGRSMAPMAVTVNVGFLSAKAMVYVLDSALGEKVMMAWGWRIPFIAAWLPGLVAIWGRRGLPETELFLEELRKRKEAKDRSAGDDNEPSDTAAGGHAGQNEQALETPAPLGGTSSSKRGAMRSRLSTRGVLASHGPTVLIGVGSVASASIMQYAGFVWCQSYLLKRGLPAGDRMLVDLCARCPMIVLSVPVGWLADIHGVGWVTFVSSCLLALGGLPLFALLVMYATDLVAAVLVVGVGFGTMGAFVGAVIFLFVSELIPTSVRGGAMGISYNVGFSLFGGLGPVLAEASLCTSADGPGFLLSLGGLISASTVAVTLFLKRRGVVQLAHVRPLPYFSFLDARDSMGGKHSASSARNPSDST